MNLSCHSQLDAAVEVITFEAAYQEAFARLNLEWIEAYFVVEPMDLQQLHHPQQIIEQGGEILFLKQQQNILGTCALINHGAAVYEIAKMAIAKEARGRGLGNLLMQTAIKAARQKGAKKLTIVSNTVLEPAINLYKKYGFVVTRLGPDPHYDRGNIELELELT